jgi:hypothetical protein
MKVGEELEKGWRRVGEGLEKGWGGYLRVFTELCHAVVKVSPPKRGSHKSLKIIKSYFFRFESLCLLYIYKL